MIFEFERCTQERLKSYKIYETILVREALEKPEKKLKMALKEG